jgi:hypothetical protein
LEGTGLEGGSIPPVIAAYSLALDGALQDQKDFFNGFEHEDFQKLDAINEIFKDAKSLARQVIINKLKFYYNVITIIAH